MKNKVKEAMICIGDQADFNNLQNALLEGELNLNADDWVNIRDTYVRFSNIYIMKLISFCFSRSCLLYRIQICLQLSKC